MISNFEFFVQKSIRYGFLSKIKAQVVTLEDSINACHPEWTALIKIALQHMQPNYLKKLSEDKDWLPGLHYLLAAFSLPLSQTHYILLGESPYPRNASANGYAFWDNAVGELWSPKGLSTAVNKATSLRNFIKMLLVARGDLQADVTQPAIARLDKSTLIHSAKQLFVKMMGQGILLLNASLVYSKGNVPYHARCWKPFMSSLFDQLMLIKPSIQLILLGNVAKQVPLNKLKVGLVAEHPYNVSFITNKRVIAFFKPMDLLAYEKY
ncbi:uracil-DNA glycosylase family protein [Legionella fallonii]|nr:uracil-DNA glycosylase [Legionella fallonii]